ncbi:MAG TPA: class I SAM-dependent rRNA methyltransferase [Firmicutes bacterium]|nr:class I SAM-dependent rRNA methyltransferase [Bacillota bacterium]
MAVVRLKPGEQKRLLAGHPWVYANEVSRIHGEFQPGDIVDVVDSRGRFVGRGFINPASQILVRLLTFEQEDVDRSFIAQRVQQAVQMRREILGDLDACRMVFGEADFLPGLIVDKFGDVLVFQTLALGMEVRKDWILESLKEVLNPRGLFERNDVPVRELEGLSLKSGFASDPFNTLVEIEEEGLRFLVDVQSGQKTGHFLDQRENRAAIARYVKGARVLDCFCHTGGFALQALRAGAEAAEGIDASELAIDLAKANAERNGVARARFTVGNVFDELRSRAKRGEKYDAIILDPPAFAKNRAALAGALRGYKEINLRAMKMLIPGGILVTCSCSQHVSEQEFFDTIAAAAHDAGVRLRLLERRGQPPDHPILVGAPETAYLKCLIFRVEK